MPEKTSTDINNEKQILSDKLNEAMGSLKGLSGKVIRKILNNDFLVKIIKIADKHLLKKNINSITQNAVFQITGKIGLILSIIILVIMLFPFFITLAAGGKIIIPVIVFAVIIALTWLIISIITGKITNGISGLIYGKINDIICAYQQEPFPEPRQ